MRAVQTLWTANKDLLKDSFGWKHPQYNLMSWALSCLTLRKHYDDVVLNTDSKGYAIFHNHLKLPYSEIIVQYDNMNCHRDFWAYTKLFTYSIQDKPFIHVDGDVYLPNGISEKIESGALIAQNAEIGTAYYKKMVDHILNQPISIPKLLLEEMKKDSVSSYNAGVLGGNDLKFIKEYCRAAFNFIENNRLRYAEDWVANVNYNILFEQILFHCLVKKKKTEVSTIIDHRINDNGYSYNEFCDFYTFDSNKLMHIIGGHKQNERICELLSRTLLNKYPEYYHRIIELFPENNKRLGKCKNKYIALNPLTKMQESLAQYKDFLDKSFLQWSDISQDELLDQEKKSYNYFSFLNNTKKKRALIKLKTNPHLFIFQIPENWDYMTKDFMKNRVSKDFAFYKFDIACIPTLLHDGYKEVPINDIHYNILVLLGKQRTFTSLLSKIKKCFPEEIRNNNAKIYQSVLLSLEYLFYYKLIYIE
ncbi:hypothetical protein JGH11_14710 [Dysgonomonas sp. Marseille-P4677]|uniref:DUF6734 family protein n=1 Tax=Dysgonomonas sp. Marseille-P4677 TaxID=2364790 RepID=UPI001914772F|nr:DUF6734 family protein [Dysgonomonas sp. Marseille-P4677]MBK5722126.1 hypothetical protein [Dysgonomonas sp. Marseille-P4677]